MVAALSVRNLHFGVHVKPSDILQLSTLAPDQSAMDECSRHTTVSALPPECSIGIQQ